MEMAALDLSEVQVVEDQEQHQGLVVAAELVLLIKVLLVAQVVVADLLKLVEEVAAELVLLALMEMLRQVELVEQE